MMRYGLVWVYRVYNIADHSKNFLVLAQTNPNIRRSRDQCMILSCLKRPKYIITKSNCMFTSFVV